VDLSRVLWIGGPPAAGKTSVARRIARRHGLRLYSADTRTWEHRDRALAAGGTAARRFESLAPDERWARRTDELLAMSLHAERGAMVLEDLRALPPAPLVVAEGSCLPAWAFARGPADRSRAVWLVPSASVQAARLAARGTTGGPARLYAALRDVAAAEAAAHDVPTIAVGDGAGEAEAAAEAVAAMLAPAIAEGPRARTAAERRALLREANAAVAAQVRAGTARPWAAGDPDAVPCDAACECGDPACEAMLRVAAGVLAARPALAPGHG